MLGYGQSHACTARNSSLGCRHIKWRKGCASTDHLRDGLSAFPCFLHVPSCLNVHVDLHRRCSPLHRIVTHFQSMTVTSPPRYSAQQVRPSPSFRPHFLSLVIHLLFPTFLVRQATSSEFSSSVSTILHTLSCLVLSLLLLLLIA